MTYSTLAVLPGVPCLFKYRGHVILQIFKMMTLNAKLKKEGVNCKCEVRNHLEINGSQWSDESHTFNRSFALI